MSGRLESGDWGNQGVSSHLPMLPVMSAQAMVAALLWLQFLLVASDHWLRSICLRYSVVLSCPGLVVVAVTVPAGLLNNSKFRSQFSTLSSLSRKAWGSCGFMLRPYAI